MRYRPLSDQVVLLTGATSGIGLATARTLSQAGARPILVARGAEDCAALAAEPERTVAAPADVADADALRAAAQVGPDRRGRIDTWTHDAGVAICGRVEEVPVEEHRRLFETNYRGSLNGMLEAPRLHRAGNGPARIVRYGSQLSDRTVISQGPYSASKARREGRDRRHAHGGDAQGAGPVDHADQTRPGRHAPTWSMPATIWTAAAPWTRPSPMGPEWRRTASSGPAPTGSAIWTWAGAAWLTAKAGQAIRPRRARAQAVCEVVRNG